MEYLAVSHFFLVVLMLLVLTLVEIVVVVLRVRILLGHETVLERVDFAAVLVDAPIAHNGNCCA